MNLLSELSASHRLRNTSLKEAKAEYRNFLSKSWRAVSDWKIGGKTFNQLASVWTDNGEFRGSEPTT